MVTWSKNQATFWVETSRTSHPPVKFSSNRHRGSKDIKSSFVTWTHVTKWSKEYVALRLDIWLLIISHPSAKFDSDRSRESEFITFFICHVTLYDHVINRLCDLIDNWPPLEPTTLASFHSHRSRGSWDITFSICHVITWLRDQIIKRLNGWWPFTIKIHLVNFGRHRPGRHGDISLFISHVTSWGHVTKGSSLPSVVAIRLVEVEIWPILIFNVRKKIHTVILLQSVTIQIRSLFWHT